MKMRKEMAMVDLGDVTSQESEGMF